MGVRLLRGRLFTDADRFETSPVCVVDEVFARRTWGEQDPIGKRMKLPARVEYATVVGVVTHVKTYGLETESPGQIYMSNAQYPWRWMSIVIRTTGEPRAITPVVTRVVHDLDRDQPVANVATMHELMASLLRGRRFNLTLLGVFAATALVLAAVGLYGVIAYGVGQRRREFGIRVALGAQRAEIARMVLGEGARIALTGAIIGAACALAANQLIASMLFEVSPRDVGALVAASAALIAVALLACILPARRAARVDPFEVLRAD